MSKLIPKDETEGLTENDLPQQEEQVFPKPTQRAKPDDSFLKSDEEVEKPEKESKEKEAPEKEEETDEEDSQVSNEKRRVPQRRFDRVYAEREEFRRRAEDSEKRVDRLAELLEQSLTVPQQRQIQRTTPDKWKKILGEDNPLTDEFYALLDEEMTAREQRAAEAAITQWEERQQQSSQAQTQFAETLRDESESFADSIGIDPTTTEGDAELAKILEIQDELTPTDDDGNYSQPLVPISVAYELYKARNASASNPQKERRAQASRAVSSGRGNIEVPRNTPKGPANPSGWRKFLGTQD